MKGRKRPLQTFFKSLAFTLAALIIFSIGALGGTIAAYIKAIPPGTLDEIVEDTINNTTVVFDEMGKEVATLNKRQSGIRVSYNQIPKDLINAIIAIEDERFWYHNGIAIKRIIGAFIHNLQRRSLSEGASTITQQLVRNKLLMFEKSFKKKDTGAIFSNSAGKETYKTADFRRVFKYNKPWKWCLWCSSCCIYLLWQRCLKTIFG